MFGWKRRRQQLMEEMEAHIAFETDENIAQGMSPEQARKAAQRTFGNVLQASEGVRAEWGWLWLERVLADVRYAARSLWAAPVYTATLLGTLALGLGCVAVMLAIVDSVLLRPMALPHSEQLVQLWAEGSPEGYHTSDVVLGYPTIEALRHAGQFFAGVGSFNNTIQPVMAQNGAEIAVVVGVSGDLLQMLELQAERGRLLGPGDSQAPVAVIGDGFWRERLHSTPEVLGMTLRIGGKLRTVVGVMPRGVKFPQGVGDGVVYLPMHANEKGEDELGMAGGQTLARLKPGVTTGQALAEAQSLYLHGAKTAKERSTRVVLRPYQDVVTGNMQRPLWTLLAGVGGILLLAYANATNLQVGRATSRMGEISVRTALGASFGRLAQQLIVESLLVSWTAGALALAGASLAIRWIRQSYGFQYTRFDELAIRPGVMLVLLAVTVVAGVAATLVPALRFRKRLLGPSSGGRGSTRLSAVPAVLVAVQIAITCVLLVTSGLLHRTIKSLSEVKLGFDPRNVSTLVLMPENQNQNPAVSRAIETRVLERLGHLPGVEGATMQSSLPFSSYSVDLNGRTDVEGHTYHDDETAHYSLVSTNFVPVSGIHLLKGRGFTAADESSADLGVLVNQAFVHAYVPLRNPIGTTLRFHRDPGDTDADLPVAQTMTIVGVVEDEVQGAELNAPYQAMVYIDFAHFPQKSLISQMFSLSAEYALRSSLPQPVLEREVRAALKQEAPGMVEMKFASMSDSVEESLGERRLALRMAVAFSSVAVVLAAAGLYGVLAYAVALRRREIGIRMALGSPRARTAWRVLRGAGVMVLFGLLPGIAGAWLAGHAIRSFLFGVQALDAATMAQVALLLLVLAMLAAAVPTLRAVQVDPAETLRAE